MALLAAWTDIAEEAVAAVQKNRMASIAYLVSREEGEVHPTV